MRLDSFLFFLAVLVESLNALSALPPRSGYNEVEARALLNLAAAAYAPSPDPCVNLTFLSVKPRLLYSSSKQICDEFANACGSFALADDLNKHLYIVFRGTRTTAQLLTEGWHSLHPATDFYGAGKAHKYFYNALVALWANVEQVLLDHRDYGVTFTGHSLGGALASLAALKTVIYNHRTGNEIKLYTFGQPRVGNVELAMRHNQLLPFSFRIVHGVDIVPHLPGCAKDDFMGETVSKPCDPDDLEKPYHHGLEIYYPHEMRPDSPHFECFGTPLGEDFNCSDSLTFIPELHFQYTYAHRHYFEHKVPAWGKLGCQGTRQQEERLPNGAESANEAGKPKRPWHTVLKAAGKFLSFG